MKKILLVTLIPAIAIFFYQCSPRNNKLESLTEESANSKEMDEEEEDGIREMQEIEFEMTKDVSLGYIPMDRLIMATEELRIARRNGTYQNRTTALSWTERGPDSDAVGPSNGNGRLGSSVTSGRMRALCVDIADATNKTVWVGGIDGGLWKTIDITASPATWTLVNDFFGNLAIASICQDPSNPNTMYFGTGEKTFNSDAVRGGGIWKSTDHGVTWNLLPSTTGFWNVSVVLCDATGNVYAATIGSGSGLQRSADGGTSWTNITPATAGGGTRVPEMVISSTGRLHVVKGYNGSAANQTGYFFTDIPSTVTSATWTSPATSFTPVQYNVDIAAAGNTLYALPASSAFETDQVWKSTDGGNNWATTTTTPPITGPAPVSSGQGWYNLAIGVDPTNANNVMAGGLNSYITTNGGTTWTANSVWVSGTPGSTNYIHADHHVIVWNDNQVLDGGDGGLFYSADDGASFADRNVGLRLKQFYSCAIHPSSANYFLAGAQDNGVHQLNGAGLTSSVEVTGGDGAFVHIDQDEPNYQWGSYVYSNFRRSTNGGTSWSSVNQSNNGQFINPSDYDDLNNRMYAGYTAGNYLRWDNPKTGSTFSTVAVAAFSGGSVRHVMVSPYTSNRVFFGTSNGKVVRADDAHTAAPSATDITQTGMSASTVSCIAVGTDDNNLIATFSNYGASHVWVTATGGGAAAWTNISGNLPDIPVRWAMFYPNDNTKAIIATEMGIFETDLINGASTVWVQNSTFPVVRTDMLQYRQSDGTMLAATHGRGLWSAIIPQYPYIRFSAASSSKGEATGGSSSCRRYTDYTVTMSIDAAPTGTATVTLSIPGGGTATQGVDYDFTTNGDFAAPSNVLTFASGSATPQNITVRVYDDAETETAESFTFNYVVSGATNALAAPSSTSHTLTVSDNDAAPLAGSGPVTATVGTFNTNLSHPFRSEFTDARTQMVFTAAEMTAAGFSAGTITSMAFNVVTKNSIAAHDGFTIKMKNTATTTMTAGGAAFESGATTVYGPVNYSTTAGINTFTLTTPFVWDGTSSVMIDICFDNAAAAGASADLVQGMSGTATEQHDRQNGTAGCSMANANFIFTGNARPVVTFTITPASNAIETVLSSNRSEYIANNGTYYFYNGTNIMNRITSAAANLGCVSSTILEAGNTWQTFLGGERSQKVFDITPTTNAGSTYTIGVYYTAAELAGKPPANLKLGKTTAATMAGANAGNTIIVTPTFTAFGTGYLFTASFTGFSKFFLVDAGVVLPVDLVSFSGYLNNQNHSALQWQTTNQYNLGHFEIQRSYDGVQFVTAGTVNAIQNPATIQNYQFTDPVLAKAVNFYRLKMVDQDGKFKYSAIARINNSKPVKFVELLQNPVKENISFLINNPGKENVSVQLFSNSGQLIKKWDPGKADGNIIVSFNNAAIANGIYTLRVSAGNKTESLKISKQ